MTKLSGKVAVITGAGRGLGEATARELALAGATVVMCDINKEEIEAAASRLLEDMPTATVTARICNVCEEADCRELLNSTKEQFGRVDILVNNAGVNITADIESISVEDWDRTMNTNLRGAFLMSKFVIPIMKNHGGVIVNVVSSLAKRIKPNSPAYVASKWGLLGFSQVLYMQARQHNIRVTALSPAGMRTRLLLERFPDLDQDKLLDPASVAKVIRFITELPDEVAIPDLFMMSLKEDTWP
ncbi:MAG: SDR family oxidoreductase [Candidatus Andersenbacteria bacterium]